MLHAQRENCPQCGISSSVQITGDKEHIFCPQCKFPLLLIAGKYRLDAVIAEGGYGIVYRARHILLTHQPLRVVKLLRPDVLKVESIRQRFQREVELTSELSQRNDHIVRIYDDFGVIPNLGPFYVMEYLEGIRLDQFFSSPGELPPLSVCFHIFRQLCSTIQFAHESGVLHRDLKPENLMLVERSNDRYFLKVLDFGIAKPLNASELGESQHLTQGIVGTPYYMSPEQCANQRVDVRSDVYALGCILFQMLTGYPPFAPREHEAISPSLVDIYRAHLSQKPPLAHELVPERVSPGLDEVMQRALSKHPAERYTSVRQLEEDVRFYMLEMEKMSSLSRPGGERGDIEPWWREQTGMEPGGDPGVQLPSAVEWEGMAVRSAHLEHEALAHRKPKPVATVQSGVPALPSDASVVEARAGRDREATARQEDPSFQASLPSSLSSRMEGRPFVNQEGWQRKTRHDPAVVSHWRQVQRWGGIVVLVCLAWLGGMLLYHVWSRAVRPAGEVKGQGVSDVGKNQRGRQPVSLAQNRPITLPGAGEKPGGALSVVQKTTPSALRARDAGERSVGSPGSRKRRDSRRKKRVVARARDSVKQERGSLQRRAKIPERPRSTTVTGQPVLHPVPRPPVSHPVPGCPAGESTSRWVRLIPYPENLAIGVAFVAGKGVALIGKRGVCLKIFSPVQVRIDGAEQRPCILSFGFRHASYRIRLKEESLHELEVKQNYCVF